MPTTTAALKIVARYNVFCFDSFSALWSNKAAFSLQIFVHRVVSASIFTTKHYKIGKNYRRTQIGFRNFLFSIMFERVSGVPDTGDPII